MWLDAFLDLVGRYRHGHHFDQTRSQYIFRRVHVISLLLALALPAWLAVDYVLLPLDLLKPIVVGRIVASCACLALFAWSARPYSLPLAYLRVALLVLALTVFQIFSNGVIQSAHYDGMVTGYDFFPFMIVGMLAVFPLTILEILAFAVAVGGAETITLRMQGTYGTVAAFGHLWLLSVLAVIAGWAAVNQLGMLLALYRQATHDPLTGLSNRRQSLAQLTGDMQECRESKRPLSVLQFDLDHFKKFNDTYGHAAGDVVLKTFAKIMRSHARPDVDLVGRHGGEEFLMALPGLDESRAREVAEGIRLSCHQTPITTPSGEQVRVTASIGLAEATADDDLDGLLQRADDALYRSKEQGRDRVTVAA